MPGMGSPWFGILWVIAASVAAFVVGAFRGWRITRRMRLPAAVGGALLSWDEDTLPIFRQDPFVGAMLLLHDAAVGAMGVLAMLTGLRVLNSPIEQLPQLEQIGRASGSLWPTTYAVVALSTAVAWYIVGARWIQPLANRRFRQIHIVLANEGVYHAQLYMPWELFGELHQDPRHGLIHLHSARSRDLIALTVRPPTRELWSAAQQIMQDRVFPPSDQQWTRWHRRKAAFGVTYLMTALPILLLYLWLYPSSAVWVCSLQGCGPLLATWLGGRVLQAYQWSEDGPHLAIDRVQVER